MNTPFGERLAAAVSERGPLCVGIDPHAPLLEQWGLPDSPEGLARFTDAVIDALAGSVAVLKPQVAFYEAFGSKGFAILERALSDLSDGGALTLADAKRGERRAVRKAWKAAADGLVADVLEHDVVVLSTGRNPVNDQIGHRAVCGLDLLLGAGLLGFGAFDLSSELLGVRQQLVTFSTARLADLFAQRFLLGT